MNMQYRKKPVVINAVLWDGKSETIFPFAPFENVTAPPEVAEDGRLHITTLEGVMVAELGDYVIKGVKGEIYPCKPDIFVLTYDMVEQAESMTEAEIIEVDDLDQFVKILTTWHASKVAVLRHMQEMPEGTEQVVDEGLPTESKNIMSGERLAGFKEGIDLSLMELGDLPFLYEMEPEVTPG